MKPHIFLFAFIAIMGFSVQAQIPDEEELEDYTESLEKILGNKTPASVLFKINVSRLVYGPNLGLDIKLGRKTWLGLFYNLHFWDFVTVAEKGTDYLSMRNWPSHQRVDGHTARLQVYFQEPDRSFFQGVGVGYKNITGTDLHENHNYFHIYHPFYLLHLQDRLFEDREQQNYYAYYTLGLRRASKYVGFEFYGSAGLVYVNIESTQRRGDIEIFPGRRSWVLPQFSLGLVMSVGI